MKISDSDIATIEALHDLLLENDICSLNHKALERARALTKKMQYHIEYQKKSNMVVSQKCTSPHHERMLNGLINECPKCGQKYESFYWDDSGTK